MSDQKKKIIIAEIENWRKNHLLPEHYCIFLLNLYTEGEGEHDRQPPKKKKGFFSSNKGSIVTNQSAPTASYGRGSLKGTGNEEIASNYAYLENGVVIQPSISWKMVGYWLLGAVLIAGLILLAFHFSGFSPLMQIATSSIFILILYMLAVIFRQRSPFLTHIFLSLSFILLILAGSYFIREFNISRTAFMLFMVLICLLWCINGLIFRFSYLLYIGILGFGLLYGYVTTDRLEGNYTWWMAELYWVPIAILMIGLGFLLSDRNRQIASVLAFCGLFYFYGSEISSLYVTTAKHDVIQLLLFIKVFLNSGFIFFTRSYWFRWLRL
ncbi:hypothetical protein ACQCN2_03485 [Brevibacillus ginsengisoli]|uniref:hypothetical protein n=1 Tax=Brevibacillus ginsengisoli TaxID=363854 RepID=UPI003CEB6F24